MTAPWAASGKNDGTHAVMGSLFAKKDGDADDVKMGFGEFEEDLKRHAPSLRSVLNTDIDFSRWRKC